VEFSSISDANQSEKCPSLKWKNSTGSKHFAHYQHSHHHSHHRLFKKCNDWHIYKHNQRPFYGHYSRQPTTRTGITSSEALEDFVGAKFYCPHDLADGNYCIQITEKTLEFSSTELHTSPLNHSVSKIDTFTTQSNSTKQDIKVHQALTDALEKVTCTDTYKVETLRY